MCTFFFNKCTRVQFKELFLRSWAKLDWADSLPWTECSTGSGCCSTRGQRPGRRPGGQVPGWAGTPEMFHCNSILDTHTDVLTVKAECPLSWKAVMGADMPSRSKNSASFYCLIWVFFHFMKSVHPQCAVAPVLYCPTLSKRFHFKQYSLFSRPSLTFLLSSQMCIYSKGMGRGEKS